jgi:hypothetical protein
MWMASPSRETCVVKCECLSNCAYVYVIMCMRVHVCMCVHIISFGYGCQRGQLVRETPMYHFSKLFERQIDATSLVGSMHIFQLCAYISVGAANIMFHYYSITACSSVHNKNTFRLCVGVLLSYRITAGHSVQKKVAPLVCVQLRHAYGLALARITHTHIHTHTHTVASRSLQKLSESGLDDPTLSANVWSQQIGRK